MLDRFIDRAEFCIFETKTLSKYIYDLIEEGEHQCLDFKFEVNDARKIAISLVAFSNTRGGKLLIGVKDNGRIVGIKTEEEFYMLDLAASIFCKPEIILQYSRWNINGKIVLEVDVVPGRKKPYYAKNDSGKWMAYFRQEDQNHLANIIQLNVWKNENRGGGILLKYSNNESTLLAYLRENGEISLSKFVSHAKINRRSAINILSKLMIFKVIDILYREGEQLYVLYDKEK